MRHSAFVAFVCLATAFSGVIWNWAPVLSADHEHVESFSDTKGHWAEDTISWGAQRNIVQGFPDGTFRPGGSVTEAQFLAMLYRAFPERNVDASTGAYWYESYYNAAAAMNWPVATSRAGKPASRGHIARIAAATQGELLGTQDAVVYVLGQGLAKGKGTGGFGADDTVTRAEAVQIVRNIVSAGLTLHEAQAEVSSNAFSAAGISLGDSEAKLIKAMGAPARKDASEYGFTWYVYNQDYRNFAMFGMSDGTVAAIYANGSNWSIGGLTASNAAKDAGNALGKPLSYILKGNTRMMLNDGGERNTFEKDGAYVTVYYDVHDGGKISAVQAVDASMEQSFRAFYASNPSSALRQSFERQSLDLANTARVKRGLKPFVWDGDIAATARKHSADMASNNYFSHTNQSGADPFRRMEADGIAFSAAAENIAAGQTSAIFAHEAWMNSKGHRVNILGDYARLGVGVAFASDGKPYYTQNFYTPLK
ncbi:CAP-associated domain-containing protein [Paenibacillus alkalitolerans]|uniref:CAP-associated domain-containing protein n=1 Tax=Paenibacillus alkalitolerans TaxID=2799335 RepID=UPI0018F493A8|nr:CAP-associated domain-containing protein [Paenibacillus alkalitolerans]